MRNDRPNVAMTLFLRLFPLILPLAVRWAERQELKILREGLPLLELHLSDARTMGVRHPERIRLLVVSSIPFPNNPILRIATRLTGLVSPHTAGMALRYGIFVRNDFAQDRSLIAHECVHTAQYERLGGIDAFLKAYLRECLEVGYPGAPLEQEAVSKTAELCG